MSVILGIILAAALTPILCIYTLALFGVVIEYKSGGTISAMIVVAIILFAGLTTWD